MEDRSGFDSLSNPGKGCLCVGGMLVILLLCSDTIYMTFSIRVFPNTLGPQQSRM